MKEIKRIEMKSQKAATYTVRNALVEAFKTADIKNPKIKQWVENYLNRRKNQPHDRRNKKDKHTIRIKGGPTIKIPRREG